MKVLGLVLADRGDLDPRRRARLSERVAVLVEVREGHWTGELAEGERRDQGVLTPALHPAEDPGAVGEGAVLVDRVPPREEVRLLGRR